VHKGQVLAVLSSAALADQRAEALAAHQRLALARSTFEREKKLWEDKITAEQDYLQARTALSEAEINQHAAQQKLAKLGAGAHDTAGLTRFELRAPIDGTVTDKRISAGQSVAEDAAVFTVSDLGSVWVEVAVSAKDLQAIQTGQRALVSASAFEAKAEGTLSYVSPLVGEQSRTATARIVLANPKGLWRPGLAVNVAVVAGEADVPVAVQAEAIQTVDGGQVVFSRNGGQFKASPVSLGRSDGRFVEVREGLHAGDTYAVRNSFVIKADLGKAGASHEH
jgi:cobalt-zinc-cadmium efflux system membrane fusion protein